MDALYVDVSPRLKREQTNGLFDSLRAKAAVGGIQWHVDGTIGKCDWVVSINIRIFGESLRVQ